MSTAEEVSKRGMAEGHWEDGLSTYARQATRQHLLIDQASLGPIERGIRAKLKTSKDETLRNRCLVFHWHGPSSSWIIFVARVDTAVSVITEREESEVTDYSDEDGSSSTSFRIEWGADSGSAGRRLCVRVCQLRGSQRMSLP